MPQIKLQHVVSVTSEDKNFLAENLLSEGGFKKWKSQKSGEKNVSVTLQFEKASKIHQIDIGNEGSAFIEVLVGKSSAKDEEFKVILVSSSFMNPIESRNNQNLNKVRMFGPDQLNQTITDENWDRVKIICSQPFNKSIQYGVSFVKFHAPPEPGEEAPPKKLSLLGGFKLKSDDSDDPIKPGSLFSKAKEKKEPPPLTGAAAVRAASKLAEDSASTVSPQTHSTVSSVTPPTHSSVKRKLTEKNDSESKKPKSEEDSTRERKYATATKAADRAASQTPLRKQTTTSSTTSNTSTGSVKKTHLKRAKSESDKPREKQFDKLMKKVVFVLSGFENPYRAQLRDKALEMGATYKSDWGKTCTHLICAFKHTPKYNQVNGKGCIVTKDWIKDCYKEKKLLPWRDYRLGKSKSPPPTSSESEEEDLIPTKKANKSPAKKSTDNGHKSKTVAQEDSGGDTDVYGGSTDEGDTEDEIQRIKAAKEKEKVPEPEASTSRAAVTEDDPYDAPTDEEDSNITNGDTLPELPSFFAEKKFFIYGKISSPERRTLKRYIVAYDGTLEEYMSENVNYLLSKADWDDNFDQASSDNSNLIFVKPTWVHACHDLQKLVPFQKFIIVPK